MPKETHPRVWALTQGYPEARYEVRILRRTPTTLEVESIKGQNPATFTLDLSGPEPVYKYAWVRYTLLSLQFTYYIPESALPQHLRARETQEVCPAQAVV